MHSYGLRGCVHRAHSTHAWHDVDELVRDNGEACGEVTRIASEVFVKRARPGHWTGVPASGTTQRGIALGARPQERGINVIETEAGGWKLPPRVEQILQQW